MYSGSLVPRHLVTGEKRLGTRLRQLKDIHLECCVIEFVCGGECGDRTEVVSTHAHAHYAYWSILARLNPDCMQCPPVALFPGPSRGQGGWEQGMTHQ